MHIGDVVCALIERDGKFLIARRPDDGRHLARKWELPGGKVEPGESALEALARELREELDVTVEVVEPMRPVEHRYPELSLRLLAFRCRLTGGTPQMGAHEELRWIGIDQAASYDFPEADQPILEEYRMRLADVAAIAANRAGQ